MQGLGIQVFILVLFILIMYFLLIRPQKKKEKEINNMRNSIQVGDEIVTIGGICGKVVKTKDETIVIQVGADKVKFEMKRWSISSVEKKSSSRADKEERTEEVKKPSPKRLKKAEKKTEEPAEEKNEAPAYEEIKEDAPNVVEAPADAVETGDAAEGDAEEK